MEATCVVAYPALIGGEREEVKDWRLRIVRHSLGSGESSSAAVHRGRRAKPEGAGKEECGLGADKLF